MKKALILIILSTFLTYFVFSGTMTVNKPNRNSNWIKGEQYNIEWNEIPKDHQRVKIRLYDSSGSTKLLEISNDTENDRTFRWTIPASVAPGRYVIRVRTLDNKASDDSDVFSISGIPDTSGSIKIISPTSMWSFTAGGNMTIKWRTSGITGNVRIQLKNAANAWNLIIRNTNPFDGSPLSWHIPDNVVQGKYFITIDQGEVTSKSGNFTINQKTSLINVTRPLGGVTKLKGEICNIAWFSSNINSHKVLIRLIPRGTQRIGSFSIINSMTDNINGNNNYQWTIPQKLPKGKYTISVEKPDGSIKGESREFSIVTSRGCDLAITSAEYCSGKLNVTIGNYGDHFTGDIVVIMIYDQFGKVKVSVPVIQKKSFILFTGKTITLNETNNVLRSAVIGCKMNYILKLIPDKNHHDTNGANNQYNGVAYKDCNVRNCDKPDLWFEKVWVKKKYRNSAFQAGDKVKVLANLIQLGRVNKNFTTSLVIYYHQKQFDPWTRVTDKRWFFVDIGRKKELSFTFTPAERGYYVFEWVTDMHKDIDERDERNNKKIGREFIWEKR